jgi:carbonic anhydrase
LQQAAGAKITPAAALQKLKEGNARFVADKPTARNYAARRAETAGSQKPFAIFLACADSRVTPELVFDQTLGDLFVVRVAGNVIDPSMLGSMEFAVVQFGVPLIVVMGHDKCGAVEAALEGVKASGNLGELLKEVHIGDKAAGLPANIAANAKFQATDMLVRSKVIDEMVKGERVQIVSAVYDLSAGTIQWLGSPKAEGKKAK